MLRELIQHGTRSACYFYITGQKEDRSQMTPAVLNWNGNFNYIWFDLKLGHKYRDVLLLRIWVFMHSIVEVHYLR